MGPIPITRLKVEPKRPEIHRPVLTPRKVPVLFSIPSQTLQDRATEALADSKYQSPKKAKTSVYGLCGFSGHI